MDPPSPNSADRGKAVVSAPAEFKTTAVQLYTDSKENKKALEKYQGKMVEISGIVDAVKGSGENTSVDLETGDPAARVSCKMASGAEQTVSGLTKEANVKLKGIGEKGEAAGGLNFSDCQLTN